MTAEWVYTALMREGVDKMLSGARGSATWKVRRRVFSFGWELRPNSVWRFGRLFLRCGRCDRLATRLYVPTKNAWPGCRRCWGLSYESRQQRNYKPTGSGFLAALGWSHRDAALSETLERRTRRAAAAKRYAQRRRILKRWTPKAGGAAEKAQIKPLTSDS
jgi:hypothetical protein